MQSNIDKPIRLSRHAQAQLAYRGTTKEEVIETVRGAKWEMAELGRLQCRKDFAYNQVWNGKRYGTKQVCPIFVDEQNEIVIVTVYVYYF
ncbi:MAG: hypothetical protein HYS55_00875 [Candidatus Omnitrophica bacterium]|nr:hypothetical protein [Candidatus Omnitrophota bacterium]